MELSLFFGRFLGLALALVSFGILINQKFYNNLWQDFIKHPIFLLLAGSLDIFLGLFIVLLHNLWVSDWRVLITLLGWLILIRGIFRVLFPETALNLASKVLTSSNTTIVNGILFLILIIGVYLAFMGFYAT